MPHLFQMVVNSLKQSKLTVSDIMLAFAQAVNLNSDAHSQHCITKCLTTILELYLSRRLKSETQDAHNQSVYLSSPLAHSAGVASGIHPNFTDEEKRAVQTLVRTYLSNFSVALTHSPDAATDGESHFNSHKNGSSLKGQNAINVKQNTADSGAQHNKDVKDSTVGDKRPSTSSEILKTNSIFRPIPSFVNYILSLNTPGGTIAPQSQSLASSSLLPNEESRESFIKLLVS
jgi:hypothetical protein